MRREIAYALRRTAPVACGYIFLGMAFGILLNEEGYGPLWALASSLFVYAGSMQFVMVSLLAAGAPLYTVAVTTFLVNARHIFYGLGFIEKYRLFAVVGILWVLLIAGLLLLGRYYYRWKELRSKGGSE